ncbi:MAG: hypothetical protein J7515_10240 [Caulobacter sp.]|nr:hypothetical protein [Caulobacter sp.]
MVSKGVDYYGYIDGNGLSSNVSITFSGPKVGSTLTAANNFTRNNLQIDSSNIPGWFNYSGPFTWTATMGGAVLSSQTNVISSLTGNLQSGTMMVMMETPSIIAPDTNTAISYGFYDAGPGTSGLTNQDQSYVYCTRVLSQWMGGLAQAYPQVQSQPFHQFALPGAHDAGMNTMDTVIQILNSGEVAALLAGLSFLAPVLTAVTASEAPIVILNAAITQKDTITTMLNLGVRYFDFRPGTMYPGITGFSGQRFHQHAVIPGMAYVAFLQEVLTWLAQNPSEIVVVSCNTQGFASSSMAPTPSDLAGDLVTAQANTGTQGLGIGDAGSLNQTYQQLISQNTRLIFLNQIDGETTKYDSYTDAYATLSPTPIIAALNAMNTAGQQDATYTVLQLQGTASGAINFTGFLSTSLTASPLMSTKAYFDTATLPWVLQNANANLTAAQPIVMLNDFIDNATVDVAVALSMQRMGLQSAL